MRMQLSYFPVESTVRIEVIEVIVASSPKSEGKKILLRTG
jgi:hypothetical protein